MKKSIFSQVLEFVNRLFRFLGFHIKRLVRSVLAVIGVVMKALLVIGLLSIFLSFFRVGAGYEGLAFIGTIVSMGLNLGFKKLMLNVYDKKIVSVYTIFSCFDVLWKHICASVLYWLVVCVGMLLLVFPGIYWGIRFFLFPFFIIDKKNISIINSLRMSWRATKGSFWSIFFMTVFFWFVEGIFFIIIMSPINWFSRWGTLYINTNIDPTKPFVSLLIFVLSVLTFLIANFSYAHLYRKLVSKQLSEQKV